MLAGKKETDFPSYTLIVPDFVSVVKKFTKFLDCKSNFSIFSGFCKKCIS